MDSRLCLLFVINVQRIHVGHRILFKKLFLVARFEVKFKDVSLFVWPSRKQNVMIWCRCGNWKIPNKFSLKTYGENEQCSKEKHKPEQSKHRPLKNRGTVKCHYGISILCLPVTHAWFDTFIKHSSHQIINS